MALVLAGVNFAKWYSGWLWFRQQSTPVRQPLQPDTSARAEEYNPEFDFVPQHRPTTLALAFSADGTRLAVSDFAPKAASEANIVAITAPG